MHDRLGVHTAPGIIHRKERVRTRGPRMTAVADRLGVQMFDPRMDRDDAHVGDGVTRVDTEVGQDLVKLGGIDFDDDLFRPRHPLHRHILAHQAPQHLDHAFDRLVQIQAAGRHHLFAGKRKQLLRDLRRPFGGMHDFGKLFAQGRMGFQRVQRQFCIAEDRPEHVVEIVRHAAGQSSDRLHFLRLLQLRLQPQTVGNVLRHRHVIHDPPRIVCDGRDRNVFGKMRAVFAPVDQPSAIDLAALQRLPHRAVEGFAVLAAVENARRLPGNILPSVSGEPFKGLVDVQDRGVLIGDHHALPALLQCGDQPLLLRLVLFTFGDVVVMFDTAAGIKPGPDRLAPMLQPALLASFAGQHMTLKLFRIGVVVVRGQHLARELVGLFENLRDRLPDEIALGLADHLIALEAEEPPHRAVDPDDVERRIQDEDADLGRVQHVVGQ